MFVLLLRHWFFFCFGNDKTSESYKPFLLRVTFQQQKKKLFVDEAHDKTVIDGDIGNVFPPDNKRRNQLHEILKVCDGWRRLKDEILSQNWIIKFERGLVSGGGCLARHDFNRVSRDFGKHLWTRKRIDVYLRPWPFVCVGLECSHINNVGETWQKMKSVPRVVLKH